MKEYAIGRAARVWCTEKNKNTAMDINLAEEFANVLIEDVERMRDAAEFLWTVVANASGGDWEKQTEEWKKAACKARDDYHSACRDFHLKTA